MYVSIKPVDHLDNKNLAKNRRMDVLWIRGNSILGHIFLGDPGYLFQEGKFYAGSDFPEGRRGGGSVQVKSTLQDQVSKFGWALL